MEVLTLILLSLFGVIIHIGSKFTDALTKKTDKAIPFWTFFKSYDWGTPIATSIVSFIMAIAIIIVRDSVQEAVGFVVTPASALVLGYIADSIWKNLQTKWKNAN